MSENIQNFENIILNKENTKEIKYTIDSNMEALVKYEYLCDSFGKEKTDLAIEKSFLEMTDLYDLNNFNTVVEILNEPSI
jgi:aspartyl-tRNA synthetase